MDNWIDLTNYGIAVAGLMVVLMGLIMSIFSRYQEEWDWKFFIILFSFLIAYVSFDLLSQFSLTMLGESAAMLSRIVENAVKHGRDPYAGPFHISIRTRRTDSDSEIVVTDNGCGFAPADGNEPHIALKNIRQRLDLMCGGSLNNVLLNRPHFNLFDAFLKAYLISPSTLSKKFDIPEHPLEGRLENR